LITNLIEHVLIVIVHQMIFLLIVIFILKHVVVQIYVTQFHVRKNFFLIIVLIIFQIVSWLKQGKSSKKILSSHHTDTTIEGVPLSELQLNTSDSWDRLSYDKDFSNRLTSISSILLFLMPLLLVLLL